MGEVLSVFITDDRSSVETLHFLVGRDLDAALAHAEADLRDNPHHLAVEIRSGDQVMAVLTRHEVAADAGPRRGQQS